MMMIVSIASCAQMNKSIIKASAYYTIPTPGTIPVDDGGNEVVIKRNKVYNIFLEVNSNSIEWTKAWVADQLFNVIPLTVKGSSVEIGKKKSDDKKVVMGAAKGNSLVQLELSPNDSYVKPPQAVKPGELLVAGKFKGKLFYYKISNVIELASPEYQ